MQTLEPIYILINFFDHNVSLKLRSGRTITGKFVKYYRVSKNLVKWSFLENENIPFYKSENDLHITSIINNEDIVEIVKID